MAMNCKNVAKSMLRVGLQAHSAKRFRHKTDSGYSLDVPVMHPDALPQVFFEYIEVEHDRTRRHSAFRYFDPDAFEAPIVA